MKRSNIGHKVINKSYNNKLLKTFKYLVFARLVYKNGLRLSPFRDLNTVCVGENGGKIVKGVNTTVDVQPGEITRQAAKFGNTVDANGLPPIWTGLGHKTGAKDTPNKGDPTYGPDGTNPKKNKPDV